MFNNLIESSSHAKEFKRRGSFLLFTTATYAVLLVISGVVSIYAYEAHLESQRTEVEILAFLPPEPPEEIAPVVPRNTLRPSSNSSTTPTRSTRTELIDSTSNPNNAPVDIGTVAPNVPPARVDSVIGPTNADPISPSGNTRGVPGGSGGQPIQIDTPDAPPAPAPKAPVIKTLKVSRVLNSEAISLPKPNYPMIARQTRTQGTVIVQVLIDETGKVISAKATSGSPLLIPEAQNAALRALFSPTLIGDQPVKVSGVITYNFVMH